MKLTLTNRHVAVSELARAQVVKQFDRLDRALNGRAISGQCVIAEERQQCVCEITVRVSGDHPLYAVARHTRLVTAARQAADKVLHQAQRLADRQKTRRRRGASDVRATAARAADAPVEKEGPGSAPRVIRGRGPAVKPMTVEDAALALADAGANFLVFRRADSESLAVIYRRPDGHFGLIEPEA